jgi:lipid II:glycine glycyltransferase (peptidoglycan interpeptide bridge formation enzyme)
MDDTSTIIIKSDIKDEKWLEFIHKCPQKEIFQTPYIRDVFEKTVNHKPFCYFALDENEHVIGSLLAYTIRERVPLSFFSRRVIVEGGPLFLENREGRIAARLLVEKFHKDMRKHAIFAEIRNHRPTENLDFAFKNVNYKYIARNNILIDLKEGEESVWRNMQRRKASKIKQAKKRGVTFKEVEEKSEVKELYQILSETYKRVRVPLEDESLFIAIFDELTPKRLAYLLITRLEGKTIGGIIPLTYEGTIYAWFMAGLREFSSYYHQNDYIVWELLRWGCSNNYEIFDFGGDIDPDKPSGIRDFKLQFGGKLSDYPRYQSVINPYYYRISQIGYSLYNKYYSGLRKKIMSEKKKQ